MKSKLTTFERILISIVISILGFLCFLSLIKIHGEVRTRPVSEFIYFGYFIYCFPGWAILGILLSEVSLLPGRNLLAQLFNHYKLIVTFVLILLGVCFFLIPSISKAYSSFLILLFFLFLTITHHVNKERYRN